MALSEAGFWVCAALVVAAMLYLRRTVGARRRLRAGILLFVLGWAGLFLGLALSDSAVFQSETVAKVWVGAWAAAIVVAILFLATAASEWLGLRRPRHQRRRFPPFR